jgi:biopolymer transport protein ExbD
VVNRWSASDLLRSTDCGLNGTCGEANRKVVGSSTQCSPPNIHDKSETSGHLRSCRTSEDLEIRHEINVTPFIDVILVLLIIFTVAAPLATVDVGVNLPASTAPEQPRPDKPVFVTIKPDGTIAVGDVTTTRDGLAAALDAATGAHKDDAIFIRGDKLLSYGELMGVMNVLRDAGYLKLALVGLETPAQKQ